MEVLKLYSREDTAKMLKISTRTLGRYKKAGWIIPKCIGGKDLYTVETINEFINNK